MKYRTLLQIISLCALCIYAPISPAYAEDTAVKAPSIKAFIKPLKLKKHLRAIKDNEIAQEQIDQLSWILSHTYEVQMHRMRGASENKVFVHKDGHKEAVFDKDGNAVKDGINDASYNYYPANTQPLMHFTFDINPWIMWGNSPTDPTTVNERIYAYMGDLEGGIKRAHAMRKKRPTIAQPLTDGQMTAIAIFSKAITHGQAEDIYNITSQDQPISDQALIDILKQIDIGFQKTYHKLAKKDLDKESAP